MPSKSEEMKVARPMYTTVRSYGGTPKKYAETVTVGVRDVPQIVRLTQKSWVNTPNFRTLVSQGLPLPDNSFNFTSWFIPVFSSEVTMPTIYDTSGGWTQTSRRYGGTAAVGVASSFKTIDRSLIASDLISRAKDMQWNAPIFIAEARKTADMVSDSAMRMVQMVRALRRGDFGGFINAAHSSARGKLSRPVNKATFQRQYGRFPRDAAANAWLQHKYGWVPFVNDVRDAVNTVMDTAERSDSQTGTVRATISRTINTRSGEERIFNDSSLGLEVFGYYETLEKLTTRAVWRFRVNPADVPGRFGLLNPAEVIWELVPYSFVADWFLPIGDYLSSLDAPMRFSHAGGTYGERYESFMTTSPTRMSPKGGSFSGLAGTGHYVGVRRGAMSSAPSVRLLSLSFEPQISASRVVSAIALLNQTLKGLGR